VSVQQLQQATSDFAQLRHYAWHGMYFHVSVALAPEALRTAVASCTK